MFQRPAAWAWTAKISKNNKLKRIPPPRVSRQPAFPDNLGCRNARALLAIIEWRETRHERGLPMYDHAGCARFAALGFLLKRGSQARGPPSPRTLEALTAVASQDANRKGLLGFNAESVAFHRGLDRIQTRPGRDVERLELSAAKGHIRRMLRHGDNAEHIAFRADHL